MTNIGNDIIKGLQEALAHARGENTNAVIHQIKLDDVDVKSIRSDLGLTQQQMAAYMGASVSGYRKWEQKKRKPSGAARTLFRIMKKEPEAVLRALTT